MKKICFVTTVPLTIRSFLLGLTKYLVENENYDVTFMCNDDDVLRNMCNERVHFIPIGMKRGVGFDGISVINKMTRIFKEQQFDILHQMLRYMRLLPRLEPKFHAGYMLSGASVIWVLQGCLVSSSKLLRNLSVINLLP